MFLVFCSPEANTTPQFACTNLFACIGVRSSVTCQDRERRRMPEAEPLPSRVGSEDGDTDGFSATLHPRTCRKGAGQAATATQTLSRRGSSAQIPQICGIWCLVPQGADTPCLRRRACRVLRIAADTPAVSSGPCRILRAQTGRGRGCGPSLRERFLLAVPGQTSPPGRPAAHPTTADWTQRGWIGLPARHGRMRRSESPLRTWVRAHAPPPLC